MKKISGLLMAFILLLSSFAPAHALTPVSEDALSISSPSAVLMEKTTGELLYSKGGDERRAPASVTKVMTMLLIAEAVDSGLISLDDTVTGSANASSIGGSQIWLEEGEQLSVSDMIKCIAVVSANDCAVAMAEHISGSEESFVTRMNERAAELGCENTNFTNCTGLFDNPEHYTSAHDLAIMSRELITHSWIRDYTTIWMDSIRDGEFGLSNTNKLVYYYDGCTGLKTGYTSTAMYCLSATAERDGVEYIAVIMHGESIDKRNEDAKALLSFGFANYALCPLRNSEALPPVLVELGMADSVQPVYEGAESILLEKQQSKDISYDLDLISSVEAPVCAGDKLGTLTVTSGSEVIAKIAVTANEDVPRLSVWGVFTQMLALLTSST